MESLYQSQPCATRYPESLLCTPITCLSPYSLLRGRSEISGCSRVFRERPQLLLWRSTRTSCLRRSSPRRTSPTPGSGLRTTHVLPTLLSKRSGPTDDHLRQWIKLAKRWRLPRQRRTASTEIFGIGTGPTDATEGFDDRAGPVLFFLG